MRAVDSGSSSAASRSLSEEVTGSPGDSQASVRSGIVCYSTVPRGLGQ